jgi:hypothetical protein
MGNPLKTLRRRSRRRSGTKAKTRASSRTIETCDEIYPDSFQADWAPMMYIVPSNQFSRENYEKALELYGDAELLNNLILLNAAPAGTC